MLKFDLVKQYLLDMELLIVSEDPSEGLVVIDDEENGIKNMVIDCEEPILVIEQVIIKTPQKDLLNFFQRLLQMNRHIVHGAFVLNEDSKIVIFRDTLQLENLDRNELEASIHSLSLALAEYGEELLSFAK